MEDQIPKDYLPLLTWPKFLYAQQKEFIRSKSWQTWFIGGNGTGKTLVVYLSDALMMIGMHPAHDVVPPVKIKCLVPSFDNVEDVAMDKLLGNQRIIFPEDGLNEVQQKWVDLLSEKKLLRDYSDQWIEIGPLLPKSLLDAKKMYSKEHKGIELKNGSSIWFATSEQGWQSQRGWEADVLSVDEEPAERVFDESMRGLRNAKGGGKIIAGLTPPFEAGQGPTWTKEKVLEASLIDPDIGVINACMADNPAITDEFIKRFSKGKTKKQIDVQVYGKYPTWGDLVHPDFQDYKWDAKKCEGHILANDTPLPDSYDVDWVMAFDWHASKPCAAVWGYVDRGGNVTFFDELDKEAAEGKEIAELADMFYSIEGAPHYKRRFTRWQDPSAKHKYNAVQLGFNAWDAFRKNGVATSAGKNRDPEVGISIMNQYFRGNMEEHPRVFIYERCKYTRRYLGNHYWKRGEDGKGKPDPKWSDYPICMRYILQELGWKHTNRRKKKWPVYSFGSVEPKRQAIDLSNFM